MSRKHNSQPEDADNILDNRTDSPSDASSTDSDTDILEFGFEASGAITMGRNATYLDSLKKKQLACTILDGAEYLSVFGEARAYKLWQGAIYRLPEYKLGNVIVPALTVSRSILESAPTPEGNKLVLCPFCFDFHGHIRDKRQAFGKPPKQAVSLIPDGAHFAELFGRTVILRKDRYYLISNSHSSKGCFYQYVWNYALLNGKAKPINEARLRADAPQLFGFAESK